MDDPINNLDPTGLDCDDAERNDLTQKMHDLIYGGDKAPNKKGLFQRWKEQVYGNHGPGTQDWETHNEQIENMELWHHRKSENIVFGAGRFSS